MVYQLFLISLFVCASSFLYPHAAMVRLATEHGEGVRSHFLATGLYGLGVRSKGLRVALGEPSCSACRPYGFFSTVDLDSYIGTGPFWVGLHNLGGGFGVHRHVERHNNTVVGQESSLRHLEVTRETIVARLADPRWLAGVSFDGFLGGIDMCLSCAPFTVITHGKLVATTHVSLAAESFAYTRSLIYNKMNARLFCAGRVGYVANGDNAEWGVEVAPGESGEAMIGLQGAIMPIKFGIAGGLALQAATRTLMNATYLQRLAQYQGQAMAIADPLVVAPAIRNRFLCSYVAFSWDNFVLGLSNYVVLPNKAQRLHSTVTLSLGCVF